MCIKTYLLFSQLSGVFSLPHTFSFLTSGASLTRRKSPVQKSPILLIMLKDIITRYTSLLVFLSGSKLLGVETKQVY